MKRYFGVGTYSEPILFGTGEVLKGKGKGLYYCSFEDGKIEILSCLPLTNPSFFCINAPKKRIYAVNEAKKYRGELGGGITEISYGTDGSMHPERSFSTGGGDPCHIAVAPSGAFVAVSNFAGGSVTAFALNGDGELTGEKELFQHSGSSVHPVRQRSAHAHSIVFFSSDKMLVPDLGMDALVRYDVSGAMPRELSEGLHKVAPGNGPRYGEFSPDGRNFYLINELGSSVTHFSVSGDSLKERETVSTLPEEYTEPNICSDLHITPDGRFLFASNRGHDSLAVFVIDPETGALMLKDRVSCGGRTPRNFCIEPEGRYILCGNQDSDTITVFSIGEGGELTMISCCDFPTPVCIRFF